MSNEKLYETMNSLLENEVVQRHSYFQLKYFTIGKEPTLQAKMHRCLTEIKACKTTIDSILLEIEETKDKISLLELDIKEIHNKIGIDGPERNEIYLRQGKRKKISLDKSLHELQEKLHYIEEESKFFVNTFLEISEIEPLKPYDDLDCQKEYWNYRLSQELKLKILLQQPINAELIQTILSLPADSEVRTSTEQLLLEMNKEIKEQHVTKSIQSR